MQPKKKPNSESEANRFLREAELLEESGDMKGAFRCFLQAAKLGNNSCMVNVGNFYAAGTGTRKNLKEAACWYKAAYRRGNPSGANNLAVDLRNQGKIREAIAWFNRAMALDSDKNCARIELAKTLILQKRGKQKAVAVLKKVLSSRTRYEEDREEARALLKKIQSAGG
jgi:TPR repeat protein